MKKEAFIEGSGRLGKLCQEPGSVFPERVRLSQVSSVPGSGWRRRTQGGSPPGGHLFWPGDPPQSPGAQRHPRLARAARDALPTASRSRGASPHPRLPRPALSLRHPQVLRHFSPRRGGREKRKRPSVCIQTLPQHKKRRGEEEGGWRRGSY